MHAALLDEGNCEGPYRWPKVDVTLWIAAGAGSLGLLSSTISSSSWRAQGTGAPIPALL
jgi:hypothetical protein